MKFVSNLRQVGSFPPVTPVSSTNKTDCHDIAEILLKVVLNTINKPKNVVITYYKETISILSFYLSFIGLVWFMVIQQYFSYIIAVSFIGGGKFEFLYFMRDCTVVGFSTTYAISAYHH
jgi:hypothetical protein